MVVLDAAGDGVGYQVHIHEKLERRTEGMAI